ncbi:uncharacterized protein LOC105662986 [Megachile rotundata]|uniref:uncharacterized protein LOC105662986 n=1 Tax=Megachile rotundata TaxID=143995 RepID=UPI003FD4E6C6
MKLCSIVGALTWIAIATATLESDSRGNWSNEKQPNYEQRTIENRTKVIIDDSPRDGILETSESIEQVEAGNEKFPDKNEENREPNKLVQAGSSPSLSIDTEQAYSETSKNVSRPARTSQSGTNETVNALQRVPTKEILPQHSIATSNHPAGDNDSNDLGYLNSSEQLDLESGADFGQRVRFSSASRSRNNENVGRARFRPLDARPFADNYRKQRRKNTRPFAVTKLNVSDPFPKGVPNRANSEEEYTGSARSKKIKLSGSSLANDEEESDDGTGKDQAAVSLGKFTGPIVVADLPRRKKYSFARTDDDEKSLQPESGYPTASSAVLNPLQVGVALMNAGQDLNSVNEPIVPVSEYLRDEPESSDSGNSSIRVDRPRESVASDGSAQSVEIQKSVEVFHTAPVHEIHYPLEFVPYVQQANSKQRPQQRAGQRPGQMNVYKSNEIPDDRERARYEYNANEDDDNSSGQETRVTDVKPVVDVRDNAEHDRTVGTYSRVERIPDTVVEAEAVPERNEFEPPKGTSKFATAVPVGIESLSALENVENPREAQDTAQTSLTEFSFPPITVPRHYPAETLRAINNDERKLPNQLEKVIEKQITIPQPFPVHVPVDRVVEKQIRIPYPIQVEKVIEKKVPFAIQRLIVPIPIHFRIPQPIPIPIEKVVEKSVPIPIPIPVEKVIEKTMHHPRPRPLDAENVRSYPPDNPKAVKNFKQIPRHYENTNYFNSTATATTTAPGATASTQYHGSSYYPVNRPFGRQQQTLHALPTMNNKFPSYGIRYPHSLVYSISNDNNANFVFYGRTFPEKDQILDEYVGPVPRKVQLSLGIQSKSLQYAPPDVQSTMRRTRQESNTGSFRQSKMEYGFKPPMVPSIQYDEQTATKVD